MRPRFTSAQLFENLLHFFREGGHFSSLFLGNKYRITQVDEKKRTYDVLYESGKTRTIPFDDLYAVYTELYRIGRMSRTYLQVGDNCQRIVGHDRYTHAPGATIYALLPCLDEAIQVENRRHLFVR